MWTRRDVMIVGAFMLAQKSSIVVVPSSVQVSVGGSAQLQAVDSSGAVVKARWGSSAAHIASVNANGVVTGVAQGTATITARSGPYSALASVSVAASLVVAIRASSSLPGNSPAVLASSRG